MNRKINVCWLQLVSYFNLEIYVNILKIRIEWNEKNK